MPWLALSLEPERSRAEAFSDALLEAGAQSVALEADGVSALLRLEDDAHALVAAAARASGIEPPRFTARRLEDQDWVRSSQAQFEGRALGRRLWVGPTWREAPAGRIAVRVDPGLAFGTGSHASTRLVLEFLEEAIAGGERVLDYGCGSGILGIAAAQLGAAQVDGADIDPQALETAAANARLNAVAMRLSSVEALAPGAYDIVIANILAQPLIVLAPLLAARAAGRIALSGILRAQAEEVRSAYDPWFEMMIAREEEGWALLTGSRR
jgi:ribosomal protein L11 methyltransferase